MHYNNILLIDDDTDDQEIFISAVGEASTEVSCDVLSNATIALEKLKAKQLEPDIIFLDLNMPIMNGEQFLKIIKTEKELRDIPIIIYSTSSNPDTIRRTKNEGIMDFLVKPDDYNVLVKILRNIFVH